MHSENLKMHYYQEDNFAYQPDVSSVAMLVGLLVGPHTDRSMLEKHSSVFQAELFAIADAAKKLIVEKNLNEKITILVDN